MRQEERAQPQGAKALFTSKLYAALKRRSSTVAHAVERASPLFPHGLPASYMVCLLPHGLFSLLLGLSLMYSGHSANEEAIRTIAGGGGVGVDHGVRFDWAAVAAFAGVAAAAFRLAGDAQRGSGQTYMDDPGADDGPAKRALFGRDAGVPRA